jgi:hypothetical protein
MDVPNTLAEDAVADLDSAHDQAFVHHIDEDSTSSDSDGTSGIVGIVVGTFIGMMAVMLVLAFFGYRHQRRHRKSAEWEGIRDEDGVTTNEKCLNGQEQDVGFELEWMHDDLECNRIGWWSQ